MPKTKIVGNSIDYFTHARTYKQEIIENLFAFFRLASVIIQMKID